MKRTLYLALIAFAVIACEKTERETPAQEEEAKLTLDFTITNGSNPDTKAVKTDWVHGDKIYVLFDKEIAYGAGTAPEYLVVAYDKNGTVTGKKQSWYASSWTKGLESKIAKRTSGTLCALYVPNDKVEGSISFEQESISRYWVYSKDRAGNEFYSYALYVNNAEYTISDGVLKASLALTYPGSGTWFQFCIKKDRSGNTIANADTHRYSLGHYCQIKLGGVDPWEGARHTRGTFPDQYVSTGFRFDVASVMSGYFYGGLCFAGFNNKYSDTDSYRHTFTLTDNKGTSSTSDDVTYIYQWPSSSETDKLTSHALVLPDLNAKDTGGNYKWVQQ